MKKHLFYLWAVLRSAFSFLPRLMITGAILAALGVLLGLLGSRLIFHGRDTLIAVDVVLPENDAQVEAAYDLVTNMESLAEFCSFRESYDLPASLESLESGQIAAVAVIPENFVQAAQSGQNIPAELILPANPGTESRLFLSIISSGARTFSYVQAGIYAVDDLLLRYGYRDALKDAEYAMNRLYIRYALSRGDFFVRENVSATGSLSVPLYYAATAVLIVLLFSGCGFLFRFAQPGRNRLDALRLCGISPGYLLFAEYLSFAVLLWLLALLCLIPTGLILGADFMALPALLGVSFLLCASIAAVWMLIARLGDAGSASVSIAVLLGLIMLMLCGRLLPSAYLPEFLSRAASFLPASYWGQLLEGLFSGICSPSMILITAGIGLVAYLLGWLAGTGKGGRA